MYVKVKYYIMDIFIIITRLHNEYSLSLRGIFYVIVGAWLAVNDNLGADPVEALLHFTGIGALNILILTLLVTPLSQKFKVSWLMQCRRLLGLYGFFYASFHLLTFLFFEVQFDWRLFFAEIVERPYITVGMAAFSILFVLAVTSWSKVKRKLGRKWQSIHNYTNLALLFVAVHFYWSVKSEIIEPAIYIVICLFLLSLRKRKFKQWFIRRQ